MDIQIDQIDWEKVNGLLPVIVQDADQLTVLMLGYMNEAALQQTRSDQKVTFYSRTKQRLWQKGETSGHYLSLVSMHLDCDQDSLLVLAKPHGPTCHLGAESCFNVPLRADVGLFGKLEQVVVDRHKNPSQESYTASLFEGGVKRIAQKVGEEGVEVAIAALVESDQDLANESADLLFHLAVLLRARDLGWQAVLEVLRCRMLEK